MGKTLQEWARETRKEILEKASLQELLEGLSAEQRLEGLTADDLLKVLPPEVRAAVARRPLRHDGDQGGRVVIVGGGAADEDVVAAVADQAVGPAAADQ